MPPWGAGAKTALLAPSPPTPARTAVPGRRRPMPCGAKKPASEERGSGAGGNALSKGALLRSGAAVLFAVGFVDAGYSGDWSRIGAISTETEELLKLGAYVVVPLCLAVAFAPSSRDGSSTDDKS